ncbi:MAG: hypothetical protein KDE51_02470 [Anaerolineales bacterium]|nr:hypothetical protein [Anaerolineales bacterium]
MTHQKDQPNLAKPNQGTNITAGRDVDLEIAGDMVAGDKNITVTVDSGAAAIGDNSIAIGERAINTPNSTISGIINTGKLTIHQTDPELLTKLDLIIAKLIDKEDPFHYDPVGNDIEEFLIEYLGTAEHPAPFGGRDDELQQLNQWLDDSAAPNIGLMTAGAGGGKSALLVQWSSQITSRDGIEVIFFPISIRFNTALQTRFFSYINKRLAKLYGETASMNTIYDPELQRAQFQDFLKQTPPNNKRLLLIVDGLDEAVWEVNHLLFPTQLGENIQICTSARYQSGDVDAQGWLRRMGWQRSGVAHVFTLGPLTKANLVNVLESMGNELDKLASSVNVLTELFRLTEGDPLLVRLYMEALYEEAGQKATLTPKDLEGIDPGLEGYFDRWWEDQEKQWEAQGNDAFYKPAVQLFFNLCAGGLGPLSREDLGQLAGKELAARQIKKVTQQVRRFIVGDGEKSGYVFSHPRLNQYFWNELFDSERQELTQRYLNYGEQTVTRLTDGQLHPQKASPYMVQHYGAHLEKAGQEGLPVKAQLYQLVCQEWLLAWEAIDGTTTGFLQDIDRAWAMANKARDIAIQTKCALCHSSVTTITSNIPTELLAALYRHEQITAAQLLAIIQNDSQGHRIQDFIKLLAPLLPQQYQLKLVAFVQTLANRHKYCSALTALVPHLPHPQRNLVCQNILQAIPNIADESNRAQILCTIAPQLPAELIPEVLLQAATFRQDKSKHISIITALAPHLPEILLTDVLQTAVHIQDESHRASILTVLAPHLPETLLTGVLQTAILIQDESRRANLLKDLVPHLPQKLLAEVLHTAALIQNESSRTAVLRALPPHLPETQLTDVLQAATLIQEESYRAYLLNDLIPHLPERVVPHVLSIATNIQAEHYRALVLRKLVPYLTERLLVEALQIADLIEDEETRTLVHIAIASHLPQAQRGSLIQNALETAKLLEDRSIAQNILENLAPHLPQKNMMEVLHMTNLIESTVYRSSAIRDLAPYLPDEALSEAVQIVRDMWNEQSQVNALWGLIPYLTPALLSETLQIAELIEEEKYLVQLMKTLIPHLWGELFTKALHLAKRIQSETWRDEIFYVLVPQLPDDLLVDALQTAELIQDKFKRIQVLCHLANRLPESQQNPVYQKALQTATFLSDEETRTAALNFFASQLPKAFLPRALQIAQLIQDESFQAEAFKMLANRLPEPEQTQVNQKAWETTKLIRDEKSQIKAVQSLALQLPDTELGDALETARLIQDKESRARTLRALAPRFPQPQQEKIYQEALQAIEQITHESSRVWALAALAPYLPESQQSQIYQKVFQGIGRIRYIRMNMIRLGDILNFIEQLPDRLVTEAIQTIKHIRFNDEADRYFILRLLLHRLPEASLVEMLQEALLIQSEYHRVEILRSLISRIPKSHLTSIYQSALQIQNEKLRAELLSYLASHLPESQKSEVCQNALQAARLIEEEQDRAKTLLSVANQTPEPQQVKIYQEVLETVRVVRESNRTNILRDLAPYLPEQLLVELQTTTLISSEFDQFLILKAITPHLPERLLGKVSQFAKRIQDKKIRAKVLCDMFSHLPKELPEEEWRGVLQETLQIVRLIPDEESRVDVFRELIPHLPATERRAILQEALQTVKLIQDEKARAKALSRFAPQWVNYQMPPLALIETFQTVTLVECWSEIQKSDAFIRWLLIDENGYNYWQMLLNQLRYYKRRDFWNQFDYLIEMGLAYVEEGQQGQQGLAIAEAIREVCVWWP